MHYHLEIIMPPVDNIEAAIESIMAPFSEDCSEGKDNVEYCRPSFWDWWQIGGRYAGDKYMAQFDKEKIDEFYKWLKDEKITVSGLQFGKQELSPPSQIDKVDMKWNEMFPRKDFQSCPIFLHSNRNSGPLDMDICKVSEIPKNATAYRVIVAAKRFEKTGEDTYSYIGPLEAFYMVEQSFYNGVSFHDSTWDKKILSAIEASQNNISDRASEDYKNTHTIHDDWIAVTVDYHS